MSAPNYRRMAAECLEIADRMSLRQDRERLVQMAERWRQLADSVEHGAASRPAESQPQTVRQQPQQQLGRLGEDE